MLKNLKALTQAAKQSALAGLFGESNSNKNQNSSTKTLKSFEPGLSECKEQKLDDENKQALVNQLGNIDEYCQENEDVLDLFSNKIEPLNFDTNRTSSDLIDFRTMKKNYESEMSLLIKNSTISSFELFDSLDRSLFNVDCSSAESSIQLSDQMNLMSLSHANDQNLTSKFSAKDLIDQINLYNKYNTSKFTEITYEIKKSDQLIIKGLLKIHWNLKNPIKIVSSDLDPGDEKRTSANLLMNNFKTTSIKDLNEKKQKQMGWDDHSLKSASLDMNSSTSLFKSQTVKCRPTSKTRATVLPSKEEDKLEKDQMFVPSYGSVSSICISNNTTCSKAIKILLEKFQISNSHDKFALYKVYQTGEIRELNDDDLPLIHRLWMGPFNQDKIFIMEKGRHTNLSLEVSYLISLPRELLSNLVNNSLREEEKEIDQLRNKYLMYSLALNERLTSLQS